MPTPSTTPPAPRSTSRSRLPSRPTTPLRPSSRSSLRASQQSLLDGPNADRTHTLTGASSADDGGGGEGGAPLAFLEPPLAEFSDAMADLEANLLHLALLHESLARFGESFASFLYGLNVNAFCADFPEAPIAESFARADCLAEPLEGHAGSAAGGDGDATFLTTDTSFVENPPASSKPSSKFSTPAPKKRGTTTGRGGGIPRPSGIARGTSTRGRGRVR